MDKLKLRATCSESAALRSARPGALGNNHQVCRRNALLAGLGCLQGLCLPHAYADSPYQEARKLVYGPTSEGRVRSCPTNINPNCVSTASNNESYAPAWRAPTSDPAAACDDLETTVLALFPEARVERSLKLDTGEYRAFSIPGIFGRDIMEFITKPEGVTNRQWEGDQPGALVTFRSMAGGVKYLWPIQQPLTDFGVQQQRLEKVREQLGWRIIGCEYIECYATKSSGFSF